MLLPPLLPGRLVQRYKRFLADVVLDDGREVTAHCANPGSMLGLAKAGSRVWLAAAVNPNRKLAFDWELVEADGALVGINTARANPVAAEAITAGLIPELAGFATLRREVRYGASSRIDILLEDPARGRAYVEVKSVTLSRRAGLAEFPDARTERGAKHLAELTQVAAAGDRAVMLFVIQRSDCVELAPAADIDPAYAAALSAAARSGVEILVRRCDVSPENVKIADALPLADFGQAG